MAADRGGKHWLGPHLDAGLPQHKAAEVRAASAELVALKAKTHEFGDGEVPDVLARFVDDELTRAERFESALRPDPAGAQELCEAFFERVVTHSPKNALTPRISSSA